MPGVKRCWVGVDLGGTKILAGVFSPRGRRLGRRKRATPFSAGGKALVAAIVETVDGALADAGVARSSIAAIGLGSPGPLDPKRGLILRSPHLAVRRLPIAPAIAKTFSRPVVLDNDVHMAMLGEWRMGAGRGFRNLVGLWIGTGVGGCVVSDGRILRGVNGNAGELGHMILDVRRARKGTDRGSLEWEASKSGMTRWLKKEIRKGRKTVLGRHAFRAGRLHSRALGDAYRGGDPLAVEAVERSARYVGIAVANLFDALAPEIFILGGGVVEDIGAPYVRLARESALAHAFSTELARPRIVASTLGDAAAPLGAALAARDAFPRR
jgi:glucokinase